MATSANPADDRLPTTGPDDVTYERYRANEVGDGALLVYDVGADGAWIQSSRHHSLETWR